MKQTRPAWRTLSIAAAAGWSLAGQAATLDEIKQRGYMVVAVSAEASPFAALQDGKRTGFDAALLDKLRHAAPFEIRETRVPEAALAATLESGQADAVATSLEIIPTRQQKFDFTPPIAEATLYYLKRSNDRTIKSIGDLGGRPLGTRTGSGGFLALTELEHNVAKSSNKPLGKPTEYASDTDASVALQSRKIDYFIDDIADLAEIAKRKPKLFAVGQPVAHKSYVAWAVAKNNGELADFLKGFVLKERGDGDLAALQQKYLGWRFAELPDSVTAQDWWTARTDRPAIYPIPALRDPD